MKFTRMVESRLPDKNLTFVRALSDACTYNVSQQDAKHFLVRLLKGRMYYDFTPEGTPLTEGYILDRDLKGYTAEDLYNWMLENGARKAKPIKRSKPMLPHYD